MIESGVRVVAADARARCTVLRVIGLLSRVATRARLLSAAAHIVGLVAARAVSVRRNLGLTQHPYVFVAGATRRRPRLAEVVRAVTADALHVPPFEQRRGGDQGFLPRVALDAAAERFLAGCVLLLVTSRAHAVRRLAVGGVGGRGVLVALRAGPRLWARVLVRTMTVQALLLGVDLHRRSLRLRLQVTVGAVTGLMSVHPQLGAHGGGLDRAEWLLFAEAVA